jgi:hypothetical protein
VLYEDPYVLCIPGKFEARFLNNCFTFNPVFADVSINYISSKPYSFAKMAPSSVVTYRFSSSSILFPTKTIIMSSPPASLLLFFAWSIHFWTFSKDALAKILMNQTSTTFTYKLCRSISQPLMSPVCIAVSNNGTFLTQLCPTLASGPSYHQRIWFSWGNRYPQWPKRNQIHLVYSLFFNYCIFDKIDATYLLLIVIRILREPQYYRSLPYRLIAKKDYLMLEEHLIICTHFVLIIWKYLI